MDRSGEIVDTAYAPKELKILNQAAKKRVLAATKAQAHYDGDFWMYVDTSRSAKFYDDFLNERTSSGTNSDYKTNNDLDYEPTQMELQFPKFIIDELSSWMFENPIAIQCDDAERDECLKVHRQNLLDEKWLQGATEGCLTGGIAVKVLWSEELKQVRVLVRPSRECFPLMDVDDQDILRKVSFVSIIDDEETVWKQTFFLAPLESNPDQLVCHVTEEKFKFSDLKNGNARGELINSKILYKDNEVIDFIPVVLIPNEPNLGAVWGQSDLEPLYDVIHELCRKYSEFGDALAFEMFPVTVFKNIDWSRVKQPEIKPGAVVEIHNDNVDVDSDVFKLESSLSPKDAVGWYVTQLLEMLYSFSKVPQITRDKVDSVGNMSGAAIRLMYLGIISKVNRKLMYWVPRMEKVYDYVLRTSAVYGDFKYREDYKLKIQPRTKLPTDEMEEVEILSRKVSAMFIAVTTAMKQLGIENPEEELVKALEEASRIRDAEEPDIMGKAIENEANSGDNFEEE